MNLEQTPYQEEYFERLGDDPEVVSRFMDEFRKEYPDAHIKIDKFDSKHGPARMETEVNFNTFREALKGSHPLGGTIKEEIIPPYSSRRGNKGEQEKRVLEFFVREVYIDDLEHCIWMNIPYTAENREKVSELVQYAQNPEEKKNNK